MLVAGLTGQLCQARVAVPPLAAFGADSIG